MKLAPRSTGSSEFNRFYIRAENGLVWTGADWSENEGGGMLFASLSDVLDEIERVQAQLDELPVLRLEATCIVEVRDAATATVEELEWFLSQAVSVHLDSGWPRPESLDDALINCRVCWTELNIVERNEGERPT